MKATGKIFVVRLRACSGDGIRELKQFLKAALRVFGLVCLSAVEESPPTLVIEHCETRDDEALGPMLPFDDGRFYAQVGTRHGHKTRWRSIRCGQQEESEMEKSDLEKLKRYAGATKSQVAFAGAIFVMSDYRTGQVTAGQARIDMVKRKLVALIPDTMGGFRQFVDKKPIYALTKVLDPNVEPIARSELGDVDKTRWLDEKDPWTGITVLVLTDPETHEVFVFPCAYGDRGAASNLIDAYADHIAAHPEVAEQLPVISFSTRSHPRSDGKGLAYDLQIDIEGWAERPKSVLHIWPPPLTITRVDRTGDGKTTSESADSTIAKSLDDKKPKRRKISVPGVPDMDDEVPF